jgi:Protein of unknown function (DUF3450).
MNLFNNIALPWYLALAVCVAAGKPLAAEPLDTAIQNTMAANKEARETQAKVEKLDDQARDQAQEYRAALEQTESLAIYNGQLEKLIGKQREELSSIADQLSRAEETQRNIVPLMLRMIDVLEKFIALDMPFVMEERRGRLQTIKEMMDRPDVTLPDKYRRIMEAYQIEVEYGRTIDTMSGMITLDGKNNTVNLLRIGRIALLYQTLDGKNSGYWSKKDQTWKNLDHDYNPSIRRGILIARKQSTPDFFKIPLEMPENTK